MADRETRRLSFGAVAADYDRYRPAPPPEALDWLIPPGAEAVLDLAAGTGAVTRGLIGRAAAVIAVEPDERMRAVLTAGCPEAEVFGLLGTYSGVITLDPERRADFAGRARAFLDRQPWDRVDLPMICRCLRSTRLPG